jgi:signal transduction histidine kinase
MFEASAFAEFVDPNVITGVEHELRTPLTAILGAANLLAAHDAELSSDLRRRVLDILRREQARLIDAVELAIHCFGTTLEHCSRHFGR